AFRVLFLCPARARHRLGRSPLPFPTLFRSREAFGLPPPSLMPIEHLTPAMEDRAFEVQMLLADRGQHRAPSIPEMGVGTGTQWRSEEHTSELQSRFDIVWRLLLEDKND